MKASTSRGPSVSKPLLDSMALALVRIWEHHAVPDFRRLVSQGCQWESLLFELANLVRDPYRTASWTGILGMNPRQMKAAIQRMQKCADEIDDINSSLTSRILMDAHRKFRIFLTLPEQVRLCASFWQLYSRMAVKPRDHLGLNVAKIRLTKYVIERTGKPHDKEVSGLIAAVLTRNDYDATAHRVWRSDHVGPDKEIEPTSRPLSTLNRT